MKKFVDTGNIIGGLAGIVGVIMFYLSIYPWLYACTAVSIVSSVINVLYGEQNSLVSEISAACIGVLIATIGSYNMINHITVAICYESAILAVFSCVVTAPLMIAKIIACKRDAL